MGLGPQLYVNIRAGQQVYNRMRFANLFTAIMVGFSTGPSVRNQY